MSETDYYKVLGVNKDSTETEIKKAYRKLAMKYHPDHAKGDASAEDKFKKISEAYAVLSDKEKRQQYDTFGSTGFQQKYSQDDIFRNFDFSSILREFGLGGGFSRAGRGDNMRFSFGGSPFGENMRQQSVKGQDLEYGMDLTLHEVAYGTQKTINLRHGDRTEQLTVKIPKGMIGGKRLRLSGKGEPSPYSGPAGDLYIRARLLGDSVFESEGNDLYVNRDIRLTEAVLGSKITVPTLEGKSLTLKVPPGTRHMTKMRLAEHGLPYMGSGRKGDLYVRIRVELPTELSDTQRRLFEELAETGI